MSFLLRTATASARSTSARLPAVGQARAPWATRVAGKSSMVVDAVKHTAKAIDRKAADAALKGIEVGEKVTEATKATIGSVSQRTDGAAGQAAGSVKGAAGEHAGAARDKMDRTAGAVKDTAEGARDKALGAAEQVKGKVKGSL